MTYLPANARLHRVPAVRSVRTGASPAFFRISLSLISDVIALWVAFWLAYQLRYRFEIGGPVFIFNQREFSDFYRSIALFTLFSLGAFVIRGVYRLPTWTSLLDEMGTVSGSITMAMGLLLLTAYLSQFSPSRLLFVYAWVLALVMLLIVRVARRQIREALWARDIGVHRVLIVGNGLAGHRLMQMLLATPGMGMRVAGFVDEQPSRATLIAGTERGIMRARNLGRLEDLPSILERTVVDEVMLALPSDGYGRVLEIATWCRMAGVPFRVVPDLLQLSLDRVQLDEISGVPILSVREATIRGANAIIKRSMDVIGAVLLLVLLALPVTIEVFALRRTTSGPILRRRSMAGRSGVPFEHLRFAMPTQDERSTGKSGWFQRGHLAGIPQLINVLRGEMSLIGPYPQTADQVARYEDWQRQRLLIRPGCTGLWFSNGRNDLTFDEAVRLDLFYAEHWSIWLDAKILLRTLVALVRGRPKA